MDRQDHVTGTPYGPDELATLQDYIEDADWTHQVDLHGAGILSGFEVTEDDPAPSMNVLVAAGKAYEGYGKRIWSNIQNTVDCSTDRDGNPTIPSAGNERYITLVAKFDRQNQDLSEESDPVRGTQIYKLQSEWHKIEVVSGAEAAAGSAVKYTAAADEVILADVLLDSSTTAITNAMLDTSRRSKIRMANEWNLMIGTSTERANHANPWEGLHWFETDTDLLYFYDGAAWTQIPRLPTPASGDAGKAVVVNSAGSGYELSNLVLPGSIGGLLVTKASATQLRVSPGYCHLRDSSGVDHLVELTTATTIDLTLSGDGRVWVYIDSSGNLSTATSAYPSRDESKGGLYNPAGDKRAIGWAPYQAGALLDFRLEDNGRVLKLIGRQVMGTSAHDGFTDQSVPVYPAVDGAVAFGGFRTSPTAGGTYLYATRPDGSTDPNGTPWAGDNANDYTSGTWEEEITASGVYELDTANQTLGRHYQFGVRLDR